ncbi:MAG: CoA pyrophosphatase [Microthrixaceae bacterium]
MTGTTRGGPQRIPRPDVVEPGPPPPWSRRLGEHPDLRDLNGLTGAAIRRSMASFPVDRAVGLAEPSARRSAVAVVLRAGGQSAAAVDPGSSPQGAGPAVLLTRRSWSLRDHSGEMAFPGGGEEPADRFPVGTALREAYEEVALDPGAVEAVGALDPLTTVLNSRVILPVVALLTAPVDLVAEPAEVAAVRWTTLSELLHPDCYRSERWSWDGGGLVAPMVGRPMHFFELPGDTIWGATATMLVQLLSIVLGVAPQ